MKNDIFLIFLLVFIWNFNAKKSVLTYNKNNAKVFQLHG